MTMTKAAIELAGIGKRFGRSEVLKGLDLAVPQGSLYGLIGLNGAGKTTTLSILLGLLRPSVGTARILGVDAARVATLDGRLGAALHRVGLEPHLTVRDNLTLHALRHGRRRVDGDGSDTIHRLLERLELAHLSRRRAAKLSQGERQRLTLARAVLLRPDVLVLDEPLTHLDPGAVQGVLDLLVSEVKERGTTVLLSSHQLEHVERVAHRLAVLHRGRVLLEGTMHDLLVGGFGGQATYIVGVSDPGAARSVLEQHERVARVTTEGPPGLLSVTLSEPKPELISQMLHAAGLSVTLLRPEQISLNDLFTQTVRGTAAGEPENAS